jgi:glutaminyl-peptide cyclotransferase
MWNGLIIVRIGRLAQLGERGVRNAEAEGSSPLPSTQPMKKQKRSGNAWWMLLGGGVLAVALAYGMQGGRTGQPSAPQATAPKSPFDGDRAFADLKAMVAFGPRPAGSEALARTRAYIVAELQKAGLKVELDEFEAVTPRGRKKMTNIRASRAGSRPGTIALVGHYDTKIFDNMSFVGANDGGSSAAWVLEMARVTKDLRLQSMLEFVFFDGEEAVAEWTDDDSVYGSKYDVSRRIKAGTLNQLKAVILVDMIGDKSLAIPKESQSTEWLTTTIWNTAKSLGYTREFPNSEQTISDDHIPFLNARVPAVDIIDFDYGPGHSYWHQAGDTLDKTSGQSLKIVGDTVYASLNEIDRRVSQ